MVVKKVSDDQVVKIRTVDGNVHMQSFTKLEESTEYELSVTQMTILQGIGFNSSKRITTLKCMLTFMIFFCVWPLFCNLIIVTYSSHLSFT